MRSTQPPTAISATFVVDHVEGEFDRLFGKEITLTISVYDIEKIESIQEPMRLVSWYRSDGFEVSCKGDRELAESIAGWFKNARLRLEATEYDFQAHLETPWGGGAQDWIKMFAQYSVSSDEEGNPRIEDFNDAPGSANLLRENDRISGKAQIALKGAGELNKD